MRFSDLNDISLAPEKGQIMAYTRTKVLFESYDSLQSLMARFQLEDFLEIHLFDQNKEYRCIVSESVRYRDRNGIIECVEDFCADDEQSVYSEERVMEDGRRIMVLNHVAYDELGMAYVNGYRMSM